jgi:serine phosphatase RsbU (regulator of sigma subunit)
MTHHIIVAASEDASAVAADLCERLRAGWPGDPPTLRQRTLDEIENEDLRKIDAVLLVAPHPTTRDLIDPLGAADEAGVAALLLVDEVPPDAGRYEFAGALIERLDAGMDRLRAVLRGMVHRQDEVRRLRREVAIANRFHGGLRGEIARIHEELQLAAMVQREFLPDELPSLYGVRLAALWRPAHYVSGDIYDITRLDDDHVGVFIADAVGHGVPAALMTMVICRSLRTKVISGSSYKIIEPGDVLGQLNEDMIRRQGTTTRFATGAYAVVNCRTRVMRFAGAGHPPPLLIRADGDVQELQTSGGLLGVFEDESYDQIEVELAVGDRFMVYSDGFEQAFPAQDADLYERRLPTTRYRDEFASLAAEASPEDMINVVGRRLDDQAGSLHQVDDLTLICMQAGALSAAPATGAGTGATDPLRLG